MYNSTYIHYIIAITFFINIFKLTFRERGMEKERKSMCSCLSYNPYWGPGL